jgi:hypothetical protein
LIPDSLQHVSSPPTYVLQGEGFVDDVTLWKTSYYNTCILALVSQADYKAQVCAQLVFICSRWLNLLKCYWFAVSWLVLQTNWRSNMDGPSPIILTSKSVSPNKDNLPKISNELKSPKAVGQPLGAQLCPLGTDNEEYDY